MGRRGVEDPGRSDRECVVALFVRGLEPPADDGAEQYRADYGPAARCQSARDQRSKEALPQARGDSVADGGIEAGSMAANRASSRGRGRRWSGAEFWMPARDERARNGQ